MAWSSFTSSIFSSGFTSSSFTTFGGTNFTWLISGGGGGVGGGGGGGGGGGSGSSFLMSAICVSNTSISAFDFLATLLASKDPKNTSKIKAAVMSSALVMVLG
ncbi:MAG TPA: hypothetical protein DCX70_06460 [Chitinophagaceae bacterium]|nr:hypothetical protein [Chitinophagaceae bacterium]